MHKLIAIALIFPLITSASEILCNSKVNDYWVKSIKINLDTKKVAINVDTYPKKETFVGSLIYADPSESGYPAYAFNVPTTMPRRTNIFKLFKPFDTWRLITVGIDNIDGQPALVALGGNTEFVCKGAFP